MKQCYIEKRFYGANRLLINKINDIIESYMRQGFTLSVRQIYYQLVTINAVPNTEQSYKRVAQVCNDGRLAGEIDWDAIEDRNRDVETRARWANGSSIVRAAADSFHRDLWAGQEFRPFVIVEKAALKGVLGGICRQWDVPLLPARGYPSVSIVRELVRDHFSGAFDDDQKVIVYHLGDHDPSGLDMTRDLVERIELFANDYGCTVDLKRLALNMDQIRKLKPPPNPAKVTDSRFEAYQKKYGHESWELDALEPSYLVKLLTDNFEKIVDHAIKADVIAETERIRERLDKTAKRFAKEGV